MFELTAAQRNLLRNEVSTLTVRVAQELAGDRGPDGRPLSEQAVQLALLKTARLLRDALTEKLDDAACRAAAAGADYGDIGAAAKLSRQGARQRWPHLAAITRAARAARKATDEHRT